MNLDAELSEIISCLHDYLQSQATSVAEYVLIQHLTKQGLFDAFAHESASLQLFKKHFLTMHSLYAIQRDIVGAGQTLMVSPLSIQLTPACPDEQTQKNVSQSDFALSQYYLDLSHFAEATEETVDELLSSFWKKYTQWQVGGDAFSVLGLKETATWSEVQKAYRRKAQLEHPDKGGDSDKFTEYTEAYQTLKSKLT